MRTTLCLALALLLAGILAAQEPGKAVKIDDMKFADKALGEKVRRLYAAADKMAGPKWDRQLFNSFPEFRAHNAHHAEWCSYRDDDKGGPGNYHGPKELNFVTFQAYFNADMADSYAHLKIVGAVVSARWKPADSGWSASMTYMTFRGKPRQGIPGPGDWFYGSWHYYPKVRDTTLMRIDWDPQFMRSFTFGAKAERTIYTIGVTQEPPRQPKPLDDEVRRILAAPESLRDHFVAAYTALRKRVETEVLANRGRYSTYYESVPPGPNGEPRASVTSTRSLTDAERQEIIKAAKVEFDGKIAAVTEHYEDLHAAVRKAFPFRECLAAAK